MVSVFFNESLFDGSAINRTVQPIYVAVNEGGIPQIDTVADQAQTCMNSAEIALEMPWSAIYRAGYRVAVATLTVITPLNGGQYAKPQKN